MDLAERLNALTEANNVPLTEKISDDEAKERFLSALEEGKTIPEAATLAGRTGRWFRNRRKPGARVYDVDFSNMYDEIMSVGGSHRESLSERMLAALVTAADSGNVRAIEKVLTAYHPDFQFLRPALVQGDVNIEKLMVVMRDVPTPLLEQVAAALEAKKRPELPFIEG